MKHYLIETFTPWHGTLFCSHWADDEEHAIEQCKEELKTDWERDPNDVEIVSVFVSDSEITRA